MGALGNLIASSSSPSQDFNWYYHLKTLALISQTPFHLCPADSFLFFVPSVAYEFNSFQSNTRGSGFVALLKPKPSA